MVNETPTMSDDATAGDRRERPRDGASQSVVTLTVRDAQGKTMAEPLTKTGAFPPMVCQMIGAGEVTGAIDQMLQKIADFYEDEVNAAVKSLTSVLEPILMLGVGAIVGVVFISMSLPSVRASCRVVRNAEQLRYGILLIWTDGVNHQGKFPNV